MRRARSAAEKMLEGRDTTRVFQTAHERRLAGQLTRGQRAHVSRIAGTGTDAATLRRARAEATRLLASRDGSKVFQTERERELGAQLGNEERERLGRMRGDGRDAGRIRAARAEASRMIAAAAKEKKEGEGGGIGGFLRGAANGVGDAAKGVANLGADVGRWAWKNRADIGLAIGVSLLLAAAPITGGASVAAAAAVNGARLGMVASRAAQGGRVAGAAMRAAGIGQRAAQGARNVVSGVPGSARVAGSRPVQVVKARNADVRALRVQLGETSTGRALTRTMPWLYGASAVSIGSNLGVELAKGRDASAKNVAMGIVGLMPATAAVTRGGLNAGRRALERRAATTTRGELPAARPNMESAVRHADNASAARGGAPAGEAAQHARGAAVAARNAERAAATGGGPHGLARQLRQTELQIRVARNQARLAQMSAASPAARLEATAARHRAEAALVQVNGTRTKLERAAREHDRLNRASQAATTVENVTWTRGLQAYLADNGVKLAGRPQHNGQNTEWALRNTLSMALLVNARAR